MVLRENKTQPFEETGRRGLVEGRLHCEGRSSLLRLLFCLKRNLFFRRMKEGGRETYCAAHPIRTLTLCFRIPQQPQEKGKCTRI